MSVSGKRLMVLGAGRGQVGLIESAKRLGCQVTVVSHRDGYPGIELADEVCYADLLDKQAVLEEARLLSVEGVATSCLDTGVPTLGYLCDQLRLVGLNEEAAARCKDKLRMKRALVNAGVPTARFCEASSPSEAYEALKTLDYPVVVKATDLQGSMGVFVCRDRAEVEHALSEIGRLSHEQSFLIEEFIEGYEFGAQAFVYQGQVLFVLPHGDNTYMAATAVPVGHYVPLELNAKQLDQVRECVTGAILAIGLDNCAVNVDLIMRDGMPYIIELTGRVGANCLPELTSLWFGIDYYEMIVRCALGDDPRITFESGDHADQPAYARMKNMERGGTVISLNDLNEGDDTVIDSRFFVSVGDEVRQFTNANDCVGQVIVIGDTPEQSERNAKRALANLRVELG